MMFDIKTEVLKLEPELISLRRDFHQHPELGYEEARTSRVIKDYLLSLGAEVSHTRKTGLVGLIRGERGEGKTVLLRADMDALPVEEKTGAPYASKTKGIMHACGHDGHIAIQLIAAKILSNHKNLFSGNVKLMFQPNEEEAGALHMIEDGVLENPIVDAAFAVHLWSPIKSGRIGLCKGPVLGTTEEFELKIKGKAGHTSTPHTAKDAILGAAKVIDALQCLGTREYDPLLPIAIVVGRICGGSARNVIADTVEIGGTIRFLFPNERENKPKVLAAFERVIKGTCEALGLTYALEFIPSNPSLLNDDQLVDIVLQAAEKTYGTTKNVENFLSLAGEDFAEISQRLPSVMTFIGVRNETNENTAFPHHHARFDIDEGMMKYGVELQVRAALDFLNGKPCEWR